MYFISSYFPTRSAVLWIGDKTRYSENEMRYSTYRDKSGVGVLLHSSVACACTCEKQIQRTQVTANVYHHESPNQYCIIRWCPVGGTESRSTLTRVMSGSCWTLPFSSVPVILLIYRRLALLRHTRHRISHLECIVLLALCATGHAVTLYPHIHPDLIRFFMPCLLPMDISTEWQKNRAAQAVQHSHHCYYPHNIDNSLRRYCRTNWKVKLRLNSTMQVEVQAVTVLEFKAI